MEHEKHPLYLGKLLVNFQSLEFVLRAFFYEETKRKSMKDRSVFDLKLDKLKEGDIVEENDFTNYDSLNKLIDKFNRNPKISSTDFKIDTTIVDVRDAIAHGRVFGDNPQPPMTLLKFSKSHDNKVKVTFSVKLTKDWFDIQLSRVQNSVLKVAKALELLHHNKL